MLGEELGDQGDGEAGADEGADRQRVAGLDRDSRRKAGVEAGANDEAVPRCRRPSFAVEIGQRHRFAAREAVTGRERDDHRLIEELVAASALVLAPRRSGVLKAHRGMKLAAADGFGELRETSLPQLEVEVRHPTGEPADRGGHQRGQGAGEGPDAELLVLLGGELGELHAGQLNAVGERGGVLEQPFSGEREAYPAAATLHERHPELLFERGDLLGHGRLRHRQRLGGAGEGPLTRDLAEAQHPPGIQLH
ncbi:MAG TPA: hypothetical protein VE571_13395 [Solirubrobacteraceae bacterium]|nr:hypothetical protein [Solirubrobacteraceae bacterium]